MIKHFLFISLLCLLMRIVESPFCNAVEAKQEYGIRVEFPFGIGEDETAVVKGTETQALICVESYIQKKIPIQLRI
jgi:hypothetical protein